MREPQRREGWVAPLLERLMDEAPGIGADTRPGGVLDLQGIRQSVRRELQWLLNTRIGRRAGLSPLTTINYGLEDFSDRQAASGDDHQAVARSITRAIQAFEPRLQQVRARVWADPARADRLLCSVEASLRTHNLMEPVVFVLAIDPQRGIEVGDAS